ncbi:uncharacterized protein LOC130367554 [Hyla sarda]|uniref:uncharacterized protein LOC130367554 n=1 Tax=Hyla sarda TaxID=327740 RepID=UPI0024C44FB2|nr:uncharacterized protein LOC130367554 [Hyla sarda]
MNLSERISSILQFLRPSSSDLHLLNESQPLQNWQTSSQVKLIGTRNVGSDGLNDLFWERISNLGGKENILLVGEAGYNPGDDGGSHEMLEELSSALFQLPKKEHFWKANKKTTYGTNNFMTSITSKSPSKSRMLEFPIVLAVFRGRLILDSTNMIKEILKDIQVRTKQSGSAIVGIVYSWDTFHDEKKMEPMGQLGNWMSQVFKDQPWGVCCYNSSEPKSILAVKRIIMETMGVTTSSDGYQLIEDDSVELERAFGELVVQLGGKERFLLLGNVCPSARNSERTRVFKEVIKALFGDDQCKMDTHEKEDNRIPGNQKKSSKECIQLPKPRSFPYPLILVVFRSEFLKDEENMAQVKEILVDIKTRVTMCSTQVIGVVCSEEPLERAQEQGYQMVLQKILHQTFRCPTGVCSFVRTKLESVDGVKSCVCNVLKMP